MKVALLFIIIGVIDAILGLVIHDDNLLILSAMFLLTSNILIGQEKIIQMLKDK